MNKNIIGIGISVIGILLMGFTIGKGLKNGENNLGYVFGCLFIVFIGVYIVNFKKKKLKK